MTPKSTAITITATSPTTPPTRKPRAQRQTVSNNMLLVIKIGFLELVTRPTHNAIGI